MASTILGALEVRSRILSDLPPAPAGFERIAAAADREALNVMDEDRAIAEFLREHERAA